MLVPLVEEGWLNKPETGMIVKKYLRPLKTRQIDTLILGCTHYPLLAGLIQTKIGRRVRLIDSSIGVAHSVRSLIAKDVDFAKRLKRDGSYRIIVSDATAQFQATACGILKRRIRLETFCA
jgi:glutamate racemase